MCIHPSQRPKFKYTIQQPSSNPHPTLSNTHSQCVFNRKNHKKMILAILISILIILIIGVTIFVRRVNKVTPEQPPVEIADDCCGSHAVCERDSLLSQTDQVIYFDDEELDSLRGIPYEEYTEAQITMLENVFYTLREQDVAGWIRSIQLRNIDLPEDIRDQALLIVAERREHTLEEWTKNNQ